MTLTYYLPYMVDFLLETQDPVGSSQVPTAKEEQILLECFNRRATFNSE